MSAPRFSMGELSAFVALYLAALGAQAAQAPLWGDAFFTALLLVFAARVAPRLRARRKRLPPAFSLAVMGFFSAVVGTFLLPLSSQRSGGRP